MEMTVVRWCYLAMGHDDYDNDDNEHEHEHD